VSVAEKSPTMREIAYLLVIVVSTHEIETSYVTLFQEFARDLVNDNMQ
jgi:hypothetical protein